MIYNYFKIALRSVLKNKLYTFINIFGLSIAFATCFLIYAWIKHETSYDEFYPDSESVFRVATIFTGEQEEGLATTFPVVKSMILDKDPDIEYSVRINDYGFLGSKPKISFQDKVFISNKLFYVDSTFFKVFGHEFIAGNASQALNRPNTAVITTSTAKKYFGDEPALGKSLLLEDETAFEVTGVIKDLPSNAHFYFDILVPMHNHPWVSQVSQYGSGIVFASYIKLNKQAQSNAVEERINHILHHQVEGSRDFLRGQRLVLQPIKDIHLHSKLDREFQANGDIGYVYLFSGIVLLVIIIAGINYINLSTAQSFRRAREVGVRKVMGALKYQLIFQFLMEAVIVTLLAFAVAIFFIQLLKQPFYQITGKYGLIEDLAVQHYSTGLFITFVIGILAGLLPASIFSSYLPVKVLKTKFIQKTSGVNWRKSLVVTQFAISIFLILATLVIGSQLHFMQNKKLGYDKEQVVVLHIGYQDVKNKIGILKSGLTEYTSILSASAVSQLPTNIYTGEGVNLSEEKRYESYYVSVDKDFFATMKIPILEGEGKIKDLTEKRYLNKYVINESTLQALDMDIKDAIGQPVLVRHGNMQYGTIIGVVEDFHFQSLHSPVSNLIFEFEPENYEYLLVKLAPGKEKESIAHMEEVWQEVAGSIPFDYQFLDSEYDKLYHNESRISKLFIAFAGIATLIACLGLFGLSSFTLQRKMKEFGIRKVFGADALVIIKLMTRDFSFAVLIAFLIATPFGYYFMQQWLSNFAYKINMNFLVFAAAGLVAFAVSIITIGYHALKAAGTNPADTLRYE